MTTLIKGMTLLTGRSETPEIANGAIVVDDNGTITAMGAASDFTADCTIDRVYGGDEYIVIPGLVDSHIHQGGTSWTFLGGRDTTVDRWMVREASTLPVDHGLEAEYLAAKLLENGVTTAITSHHPWGRYHLPFDEDPNPMQDPVIRAFDTVGLRLSFAMGSCQRNWYVEGDDDGFLSWLPDEYASFARRMAVTDSIDGVLSTFKRFNETARTDHLRFLIGGSGPEFMLMESTERIAAELPRDTGYHAHFYSTPDGPDFWNAEIGKSGFQWLDELGLLRPGTSFAHCLSGTPDDYALMADRGAMLIANGSTNLRSGVGIAPVEMGRALGLKNGVGTDDLTINGDDDLLQEARLTTLIARPGARLFTSEVEWLQMITAWGAQAAGYSDIVGTLEVGKRADAVLLDAERIIEPALAPGISVGEAVMERARGRDVVTVLIDGKPVYENRRHLRIDRPALVRRLAAQIRSLGQDEHVLREQAKAMKFAGLLDRYLADHPRYQ